MTFAVSVRALCEFTAKQGDLDRRFTPTPSAKEGMEGHLLVAARRGSGYEAEITLKGDCGDLHVRGRADGFCSKANQLEEFKTHRGRLERMPENQRALHWAQLRVYGALFCRARGLNGLRLALVYFDLGSERETVFHEERSAEELETYFAAQCERFMEWARQEAAHQALRNEALRTLAFPFPELHAAQRELAESVYRAVGSGSAVLAQAPTGVGKTVGTLFPALKAMSAHGLDRIFYLVAKTPGRALALDALARITATGSGDTPTPLRALELVAREKACEHPGKECHASSCPLARGFYDRLPAARELAAQHAVLDAPRLREIARAHDICPYYLGQEMARWADVVVGDFNYYFDGSAALYALTLMNEWKVALLIDEAHNLIERARGMYSVALARPAFETARRLAPEELRGAFLKVTRAWNAMLDNQADPYCVYEEVPSALLTALDGFISAVTAFTAEQPDVLGPEVMDLYFAAMQFCKLSMELDDDTLFDVSWRPEALTVERRRASSELCLRNVVPRRFLEPRWEAAHASVLFSATLNPPTYYRDALGLPRTTPFLDLPTPFSADQLDVRVVRSVSTRYRDRARSVQPIVRLMAEQFIERPGNYLAFFSSFEYLAQVADCFELAQPFIPVRRQRRGMGEADRRAFLAGFGVSDQGIAFAVLGGAFGEGIDLPGDQLIGAFIATLGLPQMNPINQEMQRRMQARFEAGYEYIYLYPGLQKVVQAAGRVIRSTSDRGVLYLIDDRFARPEVRQLLPTWWRASSRRAAT